MRISLEADGASDVHGTPHASWKIFVKITKLLRPELTSVTADSMFLTALYPEEQQYDYETAICRNPHNVSN